MAPPRMNTWLPSQQLIATNVTDCHLIVQQARVEFATVAAPEAALRNFCSPKASKARNATRAMKCPLSTSDHSAVCQMINGLIDGDDTDKIVLFQQKNQAIEDCHVHERGRQAVAAFLESDRYRAECDRLGRRRTKHLDDVFILVVAVRVLISGDGSHSMSLWSETWHSSLFLSDCRQKTRANCFV